MPNPFEKMVCRMDAKTVETMGKTVTINGVDYPAVESHFLPELGPMNGDGITLVVFSHEYAPRRNDAVVLDGQQYTVTQHRSFNGKPQIWLE